MRELAAAIALPATREDRALAQALEQAAMGVPRASTAGAVHRDGRRLLDGAGHPISLDGVNLGGALLWEAWIWGGELKLLHLGNQSETHIRAALDQLLGPEATQAFARAMYDGMAGDADLAAVAAHGFNVVRVPINYRLLAEPDGIAVLDRVLERAEAHGVYVVLDLHAAPGGQSKMFPADPEPRRLWDSPEAQRRTVALWRAIASHYHDRAIVAGYDLLNEPDPPDGAALVDLYARIIQAIREVDPVHLVMLEGARFGRDFSAFTTVLDANEALSFHIYTWFGNDASKHVTSDVAVAARLDVPLWCGEFGENDVASIREQVGLFAKQGVSGWAFWTWKKVKNRYPALHEIVVTPAWRATIAWITDP